MAANALLDACIDWYEDNFKAVDSPRREDVIPFLIKRLGTCYKVAQELHVHAGSIRWWLTNAGWTQDEVGGKWNAPKKPAKATVKRYRRKYP